MSRANLDLFIMGPPIIKEIRDLWKIPLLKWSQSGWQGWDGCSSVGLLYHLIRSPFCWIFPYRIRKELGSHVLRWLFLRSEVAKWSAINSLDIILLWSFFPTTTSTFLYTICGFLISLRSWLLLYSVQQYLHSIIHFAVFYVQTRHFGGIIYALKSPSSNWIFGKKGGYVFVPFLGCGGGESEVDPISSFFRRHFLPFSSPARHLLTIQGPITFKALFAVFFSFFSFREIFLFWERYCSIWICCFSPLLFFSFQKLRNISLLTFTQRSNSHIRTHNTLLGTTKNSCSIEGGNGCVCWGRYNIVLGRVGSGVKACKQASICVWGCGEITQQTPPQ